MTDTTSEPSNEAPTGDTDASSDESGVMKSLRAKAEKADALEAKVAQMERDAAFTAAGIPADGMGEMFREAYKGELDTEAITADATARGLLEPAAEARPEAEQIADDVAMQRMNAANAGASPVTPADPAGRARELGQDGFGDLEAVKRELAGLNLQEGDFDRMARGG